MSNSTNVNKFKPSLMQLKYLQAFIMSEDRVNVSRLAKEVGVDRTTIYNWEQKDDYNKWFSEQTIKAFTRSLPKVHKGMETRATKRYLDAMLYLKRFDPDYREKQEIKHKIEFDEGYSEELKKVTDKELEDME